MRALRSRVRPDIIPSEERKVRGSVGRYIYLFFLGVFALAILNYFFGDFFMLKADGLVLRDEHVVATTYIARLDSIDVTEGQAVKEGDVLLKLQSTEILDRLADLWAKQAELVAKALDFKVRAETATELLPLVKRREVEAESAIRQFDALAKGKYVTSVHYEEALRLNYEASHERVLLATQAKVLKEESAAIDQARASSNDALAKLKAIYADGIVRSPVSGTIGATIPAVGNVYRPGDPILSVYSGKPYVLVYLPRRYLFPIYVGMELRVTDGRDVADGVIAEILPVTEALPKEFQNTFQPSDRNQLAKIKLVTPSSFPLHQKVTVSRFYSLTQGLREAWNLL